MSRLTLRRKFIPPVPPPPEMVIPGMKTQFFNVSEGGLFYQDGYWWYLLDKVVTPALMEISQEDYGRRLRISGSTEVFVADPGSMTSQNPLFCQPRWIPVSPVPIGLVVQPFPKLEAESPMFEHWKGTLWLAN